MTRRVFRSVISKGRSEAWRAISICLLYDTLAALLAMYMALRIKSAIDPASSVPDFSFLPALQLVVSVILAVILTSVHRQVWRHTTAGDLRRIAKAGLLANLIFIPIEFLLHGAPDFPKDVVLIEAPLLIVLMIAGRLISRARATGQLTAVFRQAPTDSPPAILVGQAEKIAQALAHLSKSPDGLPIRPLAIIETSGAHQGRAIAGVQVLGDLKQLDHAMSVLGARYGKPPWIALASPNRDRNTMEQILNVASRHGATIQRLRLTGDTAFEPVSPTDLLSRPERRLDEIAVRQLISGARVMVTGAGGTIGGELVRQCAALGPAEIMLYDSSEYNLYEIDMELENAFPDLPRQALLGDVRDAQRLREAMENTCPDVVFHAAALKHVPLMELNPNEAILTNVEGARLAATCAAEAGAKAFVFISTDKAVEPSNVMGASKRAAELFIQAYAPTQPHTRFALVRFGNVLGSAGSVAPLFERQIEADGPVTVTHEDMTRYFMSVEEASALVMQAGALARKKDNAQASLFVLDMGEPVQIVELARRMIRLKGLQPDVDIKIEFSGLRPGEKLSERVFYPEESVIETGADGVLEAHTEYPPLHELSPMLDALIDAARRRDRGQALDLLSRLMPDASLNGARHEPDDAPLVVKTTVD